MSAFPCPNKINCHCTDDPFGNLTAEGFDQRSFFSIVHSDKWIGDCCTKVCESVVSQDAADRCAQIARLIADQGGCDVVQQPDGTLTCADPTNDPGKTVVPFDPNIPDGGDPNCPNCTPPVRIVPNNRTFGSRNCEGGWTYFDVIDDGNLYAGESLIEADRIAQSFKDIETAQGRFCCVGQTMIFCNNEFDSKDIIITGGLAPFTWDLDLALLPDGLAFVDQSGDGRHMIIAGIPSTAGLATIPVIVTSANGNLVFGNFIISITEILPDPLPVAQLNVPYPDTQLVCVGLPDGVVAAFEIISGSLPTGMTMSNDGIISGTPTGNLPANFQVAATFL